VARSNSAVEYCSTAPGVVAPSPACARALQEVVSALQEGGHDVFAMYVPFIAQFTGLATDLRSEVSPQLPLTLFETARSLWRTRASQPHHIFVTENLSIPARSKRLARCGCPTSSGASGLSASAGVIHYMRTSSKVSSHRMVKIFTLVLESARLTECGGTNFGVNTRWISW
jgi:hypothetical protein